MSSGSSACCFFASAIALFALARTAATLAASTQGNSTTTAVTLSAADLWQSTSETPSRRYLIFTPPRLGERLAHNPPRTFFGLAEVLDGQRHNRRVIQHVRDAVADDDRQQVVVFER